MFWALRGGGGGTFGVVTSVTVKAIPDPPLVEFLFSGQAPLGSDAYWYAVEYLNSFIPEFNEAGGSMYYYLNPDFTTPSGKRVSKLDALGGFAGNKRKAEVESLMKPLIDRLGNLTGQPFLQNITYVPKSASFYTTQFENPDQVGTPTILGSRLLTREFMKCADGPKNLTDTLRSMKVFLGDSNPIQGIVTVGPQVWANSDIDSALHPIWRETQLHVIIKRTWKDTTPFNQQAALQKSLTEKEVPLLKKLDTTPQGGSYLNEADAYEPNWKESFWGSNYRRLYQIKQKWDPEGLFIVRTGVGSEDWDGEGLCRK